MSLLKATTLANIADGVATELFAHEIKRVAKNIADPNTKAESKRVITMTFEFSPDENREEVNVHVEAKSKLANVKGHSKTVWCGKINGEPTIVGQDTKQLSMFDKEVAPINQGVANA